MGGVILSDPLPKGSLDQVKAILAQSYPQIRHTSIFEHDAKLSECGEFIDYHIILPPVKTNG